MNELIVVDGYVDGQKSRDIFTAAYFPGFNGETRPGDLLDIHFEGDRKEKKLTEKVMLIKDGSSFVYVGTDLSVAENYNPNDIKLPEKKSFLSGLAALL